MKKKNIYILSTHLIILISCSTKSDKIFNRTKENKEIISSIEKKSNTINFETFLNLFNTDTIYQLNSIVFPLVWINEAENDTLYFEKDEHEFLELEDKYGNYVEDSKTRIKIEEKPNENIVNLRVDDSGIRIYFYFTLKKGEWKLFKVIDSST